MTCSSATRVLISTLAVWAVTAAWAASPVPHASPEQLQDWAKRRTEAEALQREALRQKQVAADTYLAEEKACYQKFLVNRCRDEAHQKEILALRAARKLDVEGRAMERLVRQEEQEAKDAYRLQEAQARQADLQAKEAATPEDKARLQKQANAYQPDKLREAEEGARRRILEEEAHRKREQEHERKVAEKMEQARQKQAREAKAGN